MLVPKIVNNGITMVTYALVEPKGAVFDGKPIEDKDLMFDIYTFNKYYRMNINNWGLLGPVNNFLDSKLSIEEYHAFVVAMFHTRKLLGTISESARIETVIGLIDDIIFSMAQEIDLAGKLDSYLPELNISTPEFADVGKRSQDSKDMTFLEEDYKDIYKCMLLCKLLFPIFGEVIAVVKSGDDLSSDLKEKYCLGTFRTVRDIYFDSVSSKLLNYIGKITKSNNSSDLMLGFHGYTHDVISTDLFASMFVKKFVNADLMKSDGNVMTFVYTCIKKSMNSKYVKCIKDNSYFPRFDPGDEFEDEDSKVSLLELIGSSSHVTEDVKLMTKIGVRKHIEKMKLFSCVSEEEFNVIVSKYTKAIIPCSPINEYMLGLFIGDEIGGAIGMAYLGMPMLIELSINMQGFLIENGFESLCPLLTMTRSDKVNVTPDAVSNSILIKKGICLYQKNCAMEYSHINTVIHWETIFDSMIRYLVRYTHTFVMDDYFMKKADFGENVDGSTYKFEENIIEELYRFTMFMIERKRL